MIVFLIFSCSSVAPQQKTDLLPNAQQEVVDHIDVQTLHQKMSQKPVIIDVRTTEEFSSGHLPTAKNIPLDELENRLEGLTPHKTQEIFLVCATGRRSKRATDLLRSKGFTQAINVEGGTRGWQAKGFPTE